jgi:hypothetical protein
MTDLIGLAILGKLAEELGELQSAVARCIIQGVDEVHPETGKSNRQWIEEEFADVVALKALAFMHFHLKHMPERAGIKQIHKSKWLDMVAKVAEAYKQ